MLRALEKYYQIDINAGHEAENDKHAHVIIMVSSLKVHSLYELFDVRKIPQSNKKSAIFYFVTNISPHDKQG